MSAHAREVREGERFEFGENWSRFLAMVDEARIGRAMQSLRRMLGREDLKDLRFVDVGCGSGLFSLAAVRLGARVHSFDYDPASVACAREMKRRFEPEADWAIEPGSALDPAYLQGLGHFDVVYSWGVLHHTGRMWDAIDCASRLVAPGGTLFISIYNDQGAKSRRWRALKRLYNRLPGPLRAPFAMAVAVPFEVFFGLKQLLTGRFGAAIRRWTDANSVRGMNVWRDWVDWVGGYPFEVARPEEVFDFLARRGFTLTRMSTCGGGLGCNEFVLLRSAP